MTSIVVGILICIGIFMVLFVWISEIRKYFNIRINTSRFVSGYDFHDIIGPDYLLIA